MELYKNRREIGLYDALYCMKTFLRYDFEYIISFEQEVKLIAFGKTWTEDKTTGNIVPKYWFCQDDNRKFYFDNEDLFLVNLFTYNMVKRYFDTKKFHVWEEIKTI